MARDLVTIARFDIPAKAHIARNALETARIRSVIQDEQLVAMDYLLNLAVGGIKIQVWEEDAERAVAVLESSERGDRAETAVEAEGSFGDEPESVETDAAQQLLENPRDRYARKAMWAALCSVLIAPLALYTGYLLLMTMFSEGTLTGARRWGVWVAVLVTLVLTLVSPLWIGALITLITPGVTDS
jgi:hypothetical protein